MKSDGHMEQVGSAKGSPCFSNKSLILVDVIVFSLFMHPVIMKHIANSVSIIFFILTPLFTSIDVGEGHMCLGVNPLPRNASADQRRKSQWVNRC